MPTITEQLAGGRPGATVIDLANSPEVRDGDGDGHRQAAELALQQAYCQPYDPVQVAIAEALLAIGCELRGIRDRETSLAWQAARAEAEKRERPLREATVRQLGLVHPYRPEGA